MMYWQSALRGSWPRLGCVGTGQPTRLGQETVVVVAAAIVFLDVEVFCRFGVVVLLLNKQGAV